MPMTSEAYHVWHGVAHLHLHGVLERERVEALAARLRHRTTPFSTPLLIPSRLEQQCRACVFEQGRGGYLRNRVARRKVLLHPQHLRNKQPVT